MNQQNNKKPYRKNQEKLNLSDIYGKTPPHTLEFEESVLSTIIQSSDYLHLVIEFFRPEVFYREQHKHIVKAIVDLYHASKPIDLLTVTNQLRSSGTLEEAGGAYGITLLSGRGMYGSNIKFHMLIIYQKYMQRELIRICTETVSKAFENTTDVFELAEEHERMFKVLDVGNCITNTVSVNDTLEDLVKNIVDVESGKKKNFYKMNPKSLNEMLMLSPGNILLLGGKSGSGKTSLICEMMFSACELNENIEILWYSMEDLPINLITGYISSKTFLTANQIMERDYTLTKEQKVQIAEVSEKYINKFLKHITFVDRRSKILDIKAKFSNFIDKRNNSSKPQLFILVIDNLMKLTDQSTIKGEQTAKDDYIASVIGDIYDLHKENSFILMAHHFDKKQFAKENIRDAYRPAEEKLRGSARLMDVSTHIVLLNRPAAHDDLVKEYAGHDLENYLKYCMVADVTKNRIIGQIGQAYWLANLNYKFFEDI